MLHVVNRFSLKVDRWAVLGGVWYALLCFAFSLLLTVQRHWYPTIKRPFAIRTDSESNNSHQRTTKTKAQRSQRVRDHRRGHRAADQQMETYHGKKITQLNRFLKVCISMKISQFFVYGNLTAFIYAIKKFTFIRWILPWLHASEHLHMKLSGLKNKFKLC